MTHNNTLGASHATSPEATPTSPPQFNESKCSRFTEDDFKVTMYCIHESIRYGFLGSRDKDIHIRALYRYPTYKDSITEIAECNFKEMEVCYFHELLEEHLIGPIVIENETLYYNFESQNQGRIKAVEDVQNAYRRYRDLQSEQEDSGES